MNGSIWNVMMIQGWVRFQCNVPQQLELQDIVKAREFKSCESELPLSQTLRLSESLGAPATTASLL
jgi:hypothetical protein